MKFQTIISLGEDCEVAHQLRRHFGVERAGIFDWLMLPPRGLIRLLREGPDELLQFADLEPIDGRQAMASRAYGIVFHHEFKRGPDRLVDVDRVASQLERVGAKYRALWKRLDTDCQGGGPILFVCSRRRIPDVAGTGLDDGEALKALRAAAMARWPGADLHFLFLGYTPCIAADNVTFDRVEDRGDITGWSGSDRGWDEVLARHGAELSLTPAPIGH